MNKLKFKEPSIFDRLIDFFTPKQKEVVVPQTQDKVILREPVIATDTVTTKVIIREPVIATDTVTPNILHPLQTILTPVIPRKGDDSTYYWVARRYARYAAHSYGSFPDDILPDDCSIRETRRTNNGLKATLYEDSSEIICSFAGSETLKDWENNIKQLYGSSPQYEDALEYGRELQERFPYKTIVFVGHSQGGGEAAYCAYNLGAKAETFNPAGLSILTICLNDYNDDASINAYVFSTDILNNLQWALGTPADGDIHYIPDANILKHGIHGIKGILKYFEVI